MSKSIATEVLPERLAEHRAVRAWSRLDPARVEPERIEILKLRNKSAVYRLAAVGPEGSSVIAKRCRLATGSIERMLYEEFLPRLPLPALRCHGMIEEPDGEFCWLFLENACGEEYSTASAQHRALAAQWLATVHKAATRAGLQTRLPSREPSHYRELLQTSRQALLRHLANPVLRADDLRLLQAISSHFDLLETRWGELEERCAAMPPTLVHGDFATKNARVRSATAGPALLLFDWEYAGWGVPATDLAQFTGRAISPDLATYCAGLNGFLSPRDIRDVERLAECGKFFRLLDNIAWASSFLTFESYLFLEKPMTYLKLFEPRLADALRTAKWMR